MTDFERAYNRLFRTRGADTKHMAECEDIWAAAVAAERAVIRPLEFGVVLHQSEARICRNDMQHNIFSHTEPTPPEGYPAYVSINRDGDGQHTITVRSRGRDSATIEISPETLEALHIAVAADLYREA